MAARLCGMSLFLTGAEERAIFMRVSAPFGGSAAIRSRPFGATMCKGLVAQVGGASEDARS